MAVVILKWLIVVVLMTAAVAVVVKDERPRIGYSISATTLYRRSTKVGEVVGIVETKEMTKLFSYVVVRT